MQVISKAVGILVCTAGGSLRARVLVAILGSLMLCAVAAWAQAWRGFGNDPQHTALSLVPAQPLGRVRWSLLIDLQRQYSGNDLLIHYGSPLITRNNTIIVPVKTGRDGGFRMEAHRGDDGTLVWTQATRYVLPEHSWVPSVGATLTRRDRLIFPGPGGTVFRRTLPDRAGGRTTQRAFYGIARYAANPAILDATVMISTPITADGRDTLYFGFVATEDAPLGLQSGIARLKAGRGSRWISAADAAGDPTMRKVPYNSAPALSHDESVLYVAVTDVSGSGFGSGYLLALDSRTLALLARVRLKDVLSPDRDAIMADDGSASPMVGPDGDVYFGVLENPGGTNNLRGWLLHFDATLSQTKPPGAFGWDITPSVVPASAVPSYTGSSSYLVMTKYHNYVQTGGDGQNKMALLDPNATMTDPISKATVMREVQTVLGPTPDEDENLAEHPNAVIEWCVNTTAVDLFGKSAMLNSEDGQLYRWDFTTNTLSPGLRLTPGLGEAYTPTVIGPDGTVCAINNGTLFVVGR